jgi:hypothetical protein
MMTATATTTALLPRWDATYESKGWSLTLFDCINLAHCAAERAVQHCTNERFNREYETARMYGSCWNR